MKPIILLLMILLLGSCDEHVRVGAKGAVSGIDKLDGFLCFYTLEVPNKMGMYSEDNIISTLADSCGKYQIGDTVVLTASRCHPTNDTVDKPRN